MAAIGGGSFPVEKTKGWITFSFSVLWSSAQKIQDYVVFLFFYMGPAFILYPLIVY
jgi:hypothetical protein